MKVNSPGSPNNRDEKTQTGGCWKLEMPKTPWLNDVYSQVPEKITQKTYRFQTATVGR